MSCPECKGAQTVIVKVGGLNVEATCSPCQGTGKTLAEREAENSNLCPECKGAKTVHTGFFGMIAEVACPTCQGMGETNPDACTTCNGSKTTVQGVFQVECPDCPTEEAA